MNLPYLRDFFPHLLFTYDPDSIQTEAEMVSNIFLFKVMGQDGASGKFTLKNDRRTYYRVCSLLAARSSPARSPQTLR